MLHELSPTVESRALLHFPNNLKGGGHCADWPPKAQAPHIMVEAG